MSERSTSSFLNLSNGLEWIGIIEPPHYLIRIQSTACEQKRWWFIIEDLDYSFLMRAAAGDRCVVYDCSARKSNSRAIYQGLEWIRYVLNRHWFDRVIEPTVRGNRCGDYFNAVWRERTTRAMRKLDYIAKFLACDELMIEGICTPTARDGDYEFYSAALHREVPVWA